MDTTRKAAGRLFPLETWTRAASRVFLSGTRAAQSTKSNSERQKLTREIAQARILAESGYYVYLVPEAGRGKYYDALADGTSGVQRAAGEHSPPA